MTNETLKQVIDMARQSGQYRSTTLERWIRHIVCLASRDHLEVITKDNEVLGFLSWGQSKKPIYQVADKLPDNMNEGDYVNVIFACIKEGIKNGGRLLRQLRKQATDKCSDAKFLVWSREKYGNRPNIWRIRRAT